MSPTTCGCAAYGWAACGVTGLVVWQPRSAMLSATADIASPNSPFFMISSLICADRAMLEVARGGRPAPGKVHRECAPDARAAFHLHLPFVSIHDLFDDGQAQARALRGALSRISGSVKILKDARQIFLSYTDAGIAHNETNPADITLQS